MAKMGAPTKYRADFHPSSFIDLSTQGKCIAQICDDWGIKTPTIYEWKRRYEDFSNAMIVGHLAFEQWFVQLGIKAMVGQATYEGKSVRVNLGWYAWMTRNLFKWSRPDDNGGKPQMIDANPLNSDQSKALEKLPDEKLTDIIIK